MTAAAQIVTKDVYYPAPLRGSLYHDYTARGVAFAEPRGDLSPNSGGRVLINSELKSHSRTITHLTNRELSLYGIYTVQGCYLPEELWIIL